MLEIKIRTQGNVVVLDIAGAIDVNSAGLIEVIGQCIRDGYTDFLCNFEEVDTIDYIGVSVIVVAYKEVINNEGRMKFVNISLQFKNLLSVTGLDRTIEVFPEEAAALNSFGEDKAIENIKNMQLRRRFKRLPIDIKVELRGKYSGDIRSPNVEILNLSGIGAYIYDCAEFKLGEEIVLKFKMPPKTEEIEIDARVVWLPDKQIQPHLYPGMGVEFHNIEPAVQEKLLEFIDRNQPLMPTDA